MLRINQMNLLCLHENFALFATDQIYVALNSTLAFKMIFLFLYKKQHVRESKCYIHSIAIQNKNNMHAEEMLEYKHLTK
jgi:hypothetical protein